MNDLVWPELVLHVLAHLEATAHLPSSLYDPDYVQAARLQLGPIESRALGQDLTALAPQLVNHELLSQVQLLVRLHPSLASAQGAAAFELCELDDPNESDLGIRDLLLAHCALPAELLRCATLLEAEAFLRWPLPELATIQARLDQGLPAFWSLAPRLRHSRVRPLRVLGYRGRVFSDEIWVGIPNANQGPSLAHVLCQAAHEATVLEVAERARFDRVRLTEREVEHVALALLARRARDGALAFEHGEWLRTLTPKAGEWASGAELPLGLQGWLERLVHTPLGLEALERRP